MIWAMLPWGKLIAAGVIAVVVGGGYLYVKNLQSTVATLEQNNLKLTSAVETQQQVIEQQSNDINEISGAFTEQIKLTEKLQNDLSTLRNTFNKVNASGKQRDLGELAIVKPDLIEKIINNGTRNVFDCIEDITGRNFENIDINCNSVTD